MQIIVLGMHRSGTSAVTRLINMMGAYIGSEDAMGVAAPDNEKGFWERLDVRDLDDEILNSRGCRWDDPVGFNAGHLSDGEYRDFVNAANRIVMEMDAHRPWVLKEPRLCLVFPIWRKILEMPVCVLIHRSPLEVAKSLHARNGLPLSCGLALWETYALASLRGSQGLPRFLVDFDSLVLNPVQTCHYLFEQLIAAGVSGIRMPPETEIHEFVEERLRHQVADPALEKEFLSVAQMELAAAISDGSVLDWSDVPDTSAGSKAVLESHKVLQANIAEAEARAEQAREEAETARTEAETARTEAETSHREVDSLQESLRLQESWLRQIEEAHFAHIDSWRWRIGHWVVTGVEKAMMRPRPTLAIDRVSSLLREHRSWRAGSEAQRSGDNSAISLSEYDDGDAVRSSWSRIPHEEVMAARSEKPDVLIFPIIDWHFRIQRPQHIARELARQKHRVFYFTVELQAGRAYPGFEVLDNPEPGVFIATLYHKGPVLSIYDRPMGLTARESLLASVRMMMEQCAIEYAAVIVSHPFWRALVEPLRGCAVIYDCMDNHAGFSTHTPAMSDEEAKLIDAADVVVTTSQWLYDRIGRMASNTRIPNGADVDLFARAAEVSTPQPSTTPPVVGYVGAIAEWFDLQLVVSAARAYPEWNFVLVGATAGCDLRVADSVSNIQFIGECPYREVPGYVASFDVCIIPFQLTELIMATNPVKIYEYLSAGKPVVSTALPEVKSLDGLVHIAQDEVDFVDKLRLAMTERADEKLRKSRQQWASNQDWAMRGVEFARLIEEQFPKVSVIVLTYNNLALTKACLESLEAYTCYPNWELIVVDNASEDGTPQFLSELAAQKNWIKVILNETNTGFAAGNNSGIRNADGEYIIVLNNDTYVTKGWMHGLVRHLAKDNTLGAVGPVTNNIGNEAKIDLKYENMREMAQAALKYTTDHARKLMLVDVVAFFCVAVRRSVVDEIGLLDERFEVGFFEDDDYCRRIREQGYKVAIAEDVFVHHHLSASFSAMDVENRQALFERNRALYEEKWGPWKRHAYRR